MISFSMVIQKNNASDVNDVDIGCHELKTTLFVIALFLRDRSSRPEVFCKKVVLRNFSKFTGKHLCQSLFFNKVLMTASYEKP